MMLASGPSTSSKAALLMNSALTSLVAVTLAARGFDSSSARSPK